MYIVISPTLKGEIFLMVLVFLSYLQEKPFARYWGYFGRTPHGLIAMWVILTIKRFIYIFSHCLLISSECHTKTRNKKQQFAAPALVQYTWDHNGY